MNIWDKIEQSYNADVSMNLQTWYRNADTGVFTIQEILDECKCRSNNIQSILELMAQEGLLEQTIDYKCPYCKNDVDPSDLEYDSKCPHCNTDIKGRKDDLKEYIKYRISKPLSRDVKWVITIHGMNTYGSWQEEYSWRLSQMYGYSIPVSIFKYGNIKLGALLLLPKQRYIAKFGKEIRKLSQEINGGKPDVIAHSYGTLLLSEVLKCEEFKDIELGRVILVGSIVQPNYSWEKIVSEGRVEAIMCHYSHKDLWVRVAHFTIPGSGPSGFIGFNDRNTVVHVKENSYGHSDYFLEDNLYHVMNDTWAPFLTKNSNELASLNNNVDSNSPNWSKSKFRLVTHPIKIIIILAFVILLITSLVAIYFGFPSACQLITGWF